jgi:hypothetical protein
VQQDKSIDEYPEWDVEFYADENGREPCREWAERLSPQKRAAFIAAIRHVLARRGLDLVKTEYGKALGEGLYEFRIRWTAAEISHKAVRGGDRARIAVPRRKGGPWHVAT